MKARILKVLSIIGAAVVKIAFSRKFLALCLVLLLAWKSFEVVLESENPFAWILFGLLAAVLVTAAAVYMLANVRQKAVTSEPAGDEEKPNGG